MARDFNGSTDIITSTLGASEGSQTVFSWAMWFNSDDMGEGSTGTFFSKYDTTTLRYRINYENSFGADRIRMVVQFSGGAFGWNANYTLVHGAWKHLCVTWNSTAGNDPIFYIDGSNVGLANDMNTTGTFSTSGTVFLIGARNAGSGVFNGRIAEFGMWNRILTPGEAASLAKGFSPSFLKNGLTYYTPLIGNASPESELARGANGVLTGTTKAAHPRIIYPR